MDLKRLKDNPGIVLGAVALVLAGVIVLMCATGVFSTDTEESRKAGSVIININTADVEELKELEGISDVLAQRIVDYRTQNGKFSTAEEVKEVYGIGEGIFRRIKNYIKAE